MCINAETSISSFVVGTFFNILVIKSTHNVNYLMIAAIYQFLLFMQIFEFIAWKNQECNRSNNIATKGAMIFNILQPIVIIIILLQFTQVDNIIKKIIVCFLLLFYISYIINKLYYSTETSINCLKPTNSCRNLYYKWWDNIGKNGVYIYLIPIITSLLLLVKSFQFSIIHVLFMIITLIISNKFYSCGTGSIWCLFTAGGPILNYLLLKANVV
jgi:hypothetical protein